MPKSQMNLQELLDYEGLHAPWFSLHGQLPYALLKRNLKLLRGLNGASKTTLEELDRLTEQEIKDAIAAYKPRSEKNTNPTIIPATAPQFFHSIIVKSPYFSEIIPYSGTVQQNKKTTKNGAEPLSIHSTADVITRNAPSVHGFYLKEGEAFSSTRYFSEDKKSHAQIIAKNGVFQATHQNLTNEHKADLALEMSFQFLLNMPLEHKTVHISGSPEMAHRMHAAFLYLQKEAGSRYEDLKFVLPEGIAVASNESRDEYIKKHLGVFNDTPQQIVQWREFLTIKPNTPQTTHETTTQSNMSEKIKALINMGRIFYVPDLSQQEKMLLNEYQHYLINVWAHQRKDYKSGTETTIAQHEEFMTRTETVLHFLKKAPSLEKEFEAIKMLCTGTIESHHAMLESLHQHNIIYEKKVNELLSKIQETRQKSLKDCLHFIDEHLKSSVTLNVDLSDTDREDLLKHRHAIVEINDFIEKQPVISDEMMRSCCTQAHHAMNFLASISPVYNTTPHVQEIKQFLIKQSETESRTQSNSNKTTTEQLMKACNHVKERLHQFKKEFEKTKESEVFLDAKTKEQCDALIKKVNRFIKGMEAEEGKLSLEQLSTNMKQISGSPIGSKMHIDALNKSIDDSLPLVQENHELVRMLSQLKTQVTEPSALDALVPVSNPVLGQNM